MTCLNDIRSTFLDYFARQGHAKVPSSSLVPETDGLNLRQFKMKIKY